MEAMAALELGQLIVLGCGRSLLRAHRMLLAAPESPSPGWGHPLPRTGMALGGNFSLADHQAQGMHSAPWVPGWMPWAGATRLRVQPGSLSSAALHNGPGTGSRGAWEPGGWESAARDFTEPCAVRQRRCLALKAVSGAVI